MKHGTRQSSCLLTRTSRDARRRGVALLMVLGMVGLVFVIGVSLLAGLPASAGASENLARRETAVYLAESGLEEAMYRLANPPRGEDIWNGVNGRTLPGVQGSYSVAVTQPPELEEDEYHIRATGHVPDGHGATRSHVVTLVVRVESAYTGPSVTLRHAGVYGNGGSIPQGAEIDGDIHVNGIVINRGRVNGKLTSSSLVLDLGRADEVQSFADRVETPSIDFDDYPRYQYNGRTYAAQVLRANEARAVTRLNPVTAANPLGVVVVDGNLKLRRSMDVNEGILVVRGKLDLNGERLSVQGHEDFVSLLIEHRVRFSRSNSELTVSRGAAYFRERIDSHWRARNNRIELDGGVIAEHGLPLMFNGTIRVRYEDVEDGGSATLKYIGAQAGDADADSGAGGSGGRTVVPLRYSPTGS